MRTSKKQIKANKQNAQLSSGPKSIKGREIVSKNAIKHGILSQEVVLDLENKNQYELLYKSFVQDLQPVGAVENMLVERVVTTYWRMHRVITAESGAIKNKLDHFTFKQFLRRVKQAERYDAYTTLTSFYTRLTNSLSCKRFIEVVEELIKIVKEYGYLPELEFKKFTDITNAFTDKDSLTWFAFFNAIAQGKVDKEPKEKGTKALLYTLQKKLDHAKALNDVNKEMEEDEDDAGAMMASIPRTEMIEKLTRYERSLEKSLYRALDQLLKVQALRKGGKVLSVKSAEIEGISTE